MSLATTSATANGDSVTSPDSTTNPIPSTLTDEEREDAIGRLQTFLRFETVSATSPTTGAYRDCAQFLLEQLQSLDALDDVHYLPEAPDHSPVVVAWWRGKDMTLPIILLNSHYDVVPADHDAWTVPPFGAIRTNGRVYGRGAQDMKSVCMQYIEAVRTLHRTDPRWQPERSLLFTFVPDEEIGGSGMAAFLDSDLYRNKIPSGIALALDEGLASRTSVFDVFFGERLPWWVQVKATGPTGHASRFVDNTAVEQLLELSQKALAFRKGQRSKLDMNHDENCTHAVVAAKQKSTTSNTTSNTKEVMTLGDVTSLNITTLQAGVAVGDTYAYNVVPSTATCSLDIRISPHMDPHEMKELLDGWCQECSRDPNAGSAVTWYSIGGSDNAMTHATTETDRTINPWYGVFCDTLRDLGCDVSPQVFPAATDSRFLRALGIRALGFSPMRNTEILLHEHDEYILESNFLEGIEVYARLFRALGSQGADIDRPHNKKA